MLLSVILLYLAAFPTACRTQSSELHVCVDMHGAVLIDI